MFLHQFVAVRLCLYLISGILFGAVVGVSISLAIANVVVWFLVLSFLFRRVFQRDRIWFGLVAAILFFSIGLLSLSLRIPGNYPNYFAGKKIIKEELIVLKIREELKPTSYNRRYITHVQQVGGEPTSGQMLWELSPPEDSTIFLVDDLIYVWGLAESVLTPLNPGGFNYSRYLKSKGIEYRLKTSPRAVLKVVPGQQTLRGVAARIRTALINLFSDTFMESRELSIVQALLFGFRDSITEETYTAYKNSGAVHILAVSGLHVGILLTFIRILIRPILKLKYGKKMYLLLQIALLWSFALITGWSASVVRAVTMCSFFAYALYLNRPSNSYNLLSLSILFIVLVIDPYLLFHVGFQLSYAAVIGIIWIYPILRDFYRPRYRIVKKVYEILCVSIAAQAGVLPVSLLYFHQFPGLFFITNLLLMPVLGSILVGGLVLSLWLMVSSVPRIFILLYEKLLWLMNEVVYLIGGMEFFTFKNIPFDIPKLVLTYLLIYACFQFLKTRKSIFVISALASILGLQIWSILTVYTKSHKVQFITFHSSREHLIAERNGLRLYLNYKSDLENRSWFQNYIREERIREIEKFSPGYSINFLKEKIYIMDSLGLFPPQNYHPEIIMLTTSPKVNLDRLLDTLQPQLVIADGSNYPSHIRRWRKSCSLLNLPFHYTGDAGALILDKHGLVNIAH